MILLSDMPFIKYEACTKVSLHCMMPLFPITKMVELLLLNHDRACHIMFIKKDRYDKKLQSKPVCKLWVFSKNQAVRRDSSEVIMTRHHA